MGKVIETAEGNRQMLMSAGTIVSDCCKVIVILDDTGNYQCSGCMKPCQSGGTLGELASANTRQRAERAARKLAHELNGGNRPDCSYPPELAALIDDPSIDNEAALAKWATDIIAAELDK